MRAPKDVCQVPSVDAPSGCDPGVQDSLSSLVEKIDEEKKKKIEEKEKKKTNIKNKN